MIKKTGVTEWIPLEVWDSSQLNNEYINKIFKNQNVNHLKQSDNRHFSSPCASYSVINKQMKSFYRLLLLSLISDL